MRSLSILTLGIACLAGCVAPQDPDPPNSAPGTTTTFVLVRHAERDPGTDPPLNTEGEARAQALKEALSQHGVTAIWTTSWQRNTQTVRPLEEELDLTANVIPVASLVDTAGVAEDFIDAALRDHQGGTVLFVGNNTAVVGSVGITETIYQQLGGTGRGPTRYSDMFIVIVPESGPPRIITASYGGSSSLD